MSTSKLDPIPALHTPDSVNITASLFDTGGGKNSKIEVLLASDQDELDLDPQKFKWVRTSAERPGSRKVIVDNMKPTISWGTEGDDGQFDRCLKRYLKSLAKPLEAGLRSMMSLVDKRRKTA